jgi:hypothetical protein
MFGPDSRILPGGLPNRLTTAGHTTRRAIEFTIRMTYQIHPRSLKNGGRRPRYAATLSKAQACRTLPAGETGGSINRHFTAQYLLHCTTFTMASCLIYTPTSITLPPCQVTQRRGRGLHDGRQDLDRAKHKYSQSQGSRVQQLKRRAC